MAKARSPNYPTMDLASALALIQPVWKAEGRNKMGRITLAKHLGYNSLNGRALSKMGALRTYGLIHGLGDDLRISPDAIVCIMAPPESDERAAALLRCAMRPSLFKEIRGDSPGEPPSEANLQFQLVKKGYSPEAAGKAARSYLETMRLVGESGDAYSSEAAAEGEDMSETHEERAAPSPRRGGPEPLSPVTQTPAGMRKAVFTLAEGDVTLTFPSDLSLEGFEELGDYLEIFLRRAQRAKAGTPEQ